MNRAIKLLTLVGFLATGLLRAALTMTAATAQERVDFRRDIEPILAGHCYQCHGPRKASGQLRLDLKAGAMKGGISGAAIVPGASGESLLVKRLLGEGGQARMPMGGEPLTDAQIKLVRAWIDQGALWPGGSGETADSGDSPKDGGIARHWAYIKPVQPAPPRVSNPSWVRNPIDAFILARLDREGLKPSAEADKAVLLRRLYLDLTGLPPTVKEVDDFLADSSEDACEKAVDRLLASPRYGERWARPWLDLARYADSNGYEKDNIRTAWKFRDWVIGAFNADMPFDQFTIEQLAGDMLPNPTDDQRIATGFHRNTMVNQEGGIDPEENRFEILVDRVNTTSTVWLGSTLGCAQCHNHKYDPFTQKDYYRLMAFFDNAEYQIAYQTAGEESSRYISEPQLSLPTPEQAAKRRVIDDEMRQIEARLKTQTPELDAEQARWERELLLEQKRWTVLNPVKYESSGGATLSLLEDGSILAAGNKAEYDTYSINARTDLKNITAVRIEALPDESLPKGGPGRDPYGNFLLTGIGIETTSGPQAPSFNDVFLDDSAYRLEKKDFFSGKPANPATDRPAGWFVNATRDQARLPRQGVFILDRPLSASAPFTIKLHFRGGSLNQAIGRLRLSVTNSTDPKRVVSVPASLRSVLSIPVDKRTPKQKTDLSAQFRATTPLLKKERDRLEQLRTELRALGIVNALVMQERPAHDRPFTYLRERGSFLNRGEKVYAATPATLHPLPESAQMNRLGLARWIVDENNPLTSRVTVNRFWEQIFGHGLVETSEDFGSQGERPVNQELLDWLAVEFNKPAEKGGLGWSVKKLLRLMVTSSTYRQSSSASPALIEKDPYNRLLARGPRFRMEAEMIRDTSLAASGLLSAKIGGPSVFPLQPEGVWKAPYSGEKWVTSKGEDKYRRTLYTFIRRSAPFPMMLTFDATSREFCTVRRVRTNTPLQALTLLNDEASMEYARALVSRAASEAGGDPRTRIAYAFRLCVTRLPADRETERLLQLYNQQLEFFRAHPEEARKVSGSKDSLTDAADAAAWIMVANVLLNLDETISKQ